jgi:flavin-binding protein dodecin
MLEEDGGIFTSFFCLNTPQEAPMPDQIYKSIELTGSSTTGVENAIQNALDKASKSIRNMRWFKVDDIRGHIVDNKVAHWQVSMKVGFALED